MSKNQYIGAGLILSAIFYAKFTNLNGLSTFNVGVLMLFGGMAWLGISLLIPNPGGERFSFWKMILKGVLGFIAMTGVLVFGINNTDQYVKQELADYGVTTTAVVVEKDYTTLPARWGKVNYVYTLKLEFKDQNGRTQQVKSEVNKYEFDHLYQGSSLQIHYSSHHPEVHRLVMD